MGHSIGLMSFPSDGGDDFQVKPYSKHFQQMMDMVSSLHITGYGLKGHTLVKNRNLHVFMAYGGSSSSQDYHSRLHQQP